MVTTFCISQILIRLLGVSMFRVSRYIPDRRTSDGPSPLLSLSFSYYVLVRPVPSLSHTRCFICMQRADYSIPMPITILTRNLTRKYMKCVKSMPHPSRSRCTTCTRTRSWRWRWACFWIFPALFYYSRYVCIVLVADRS